MRLTAVQRVVYLAPTAKRYYFTRRAAAGAEARALIKRKYPTERPESEGGYVTYRGWHWSEDERLVKVCSRLTKRILRLALSSGSEP
ncbi:hypothetical protein [Mesorhizobium sp. ORM16]|uniref:hypothetical protein n=1 Tax=Mesorhizobium sp. ORM16 TaxID=3376989 RepID=UPI00385776B7